MIETTVEITLPMREYFQQVMAEYRATGWINEQYIDVTKEDIQVFPVLAPFVDGQGYIDVINWKLVTD